MPILGIVIIAVITFGVCFLLDKGFSKAFRNKSQYRTGLEVRLNKRYAVFGLVLALIGILGVIYGAGSDLVLLIGGIIVLLMGAGLIVYYLSFGVFYDEESFLLNKFGKKTAQYSYADIRTQRLYLIQGGNVVIELTLSDGRAVSLQANMPGVYSFLDYAFSAWCRQTGRDPESCDFHDPSQSLWFPTEEG